jgi:hypothetical protein
MIDSIWNWPSIVMPSSFVAVDELPGAAWGASGGSVSARDRDASSTISAAPHSGQNRPDSSVRRSQEEQTLTEIERSSP